MHIISLEAKVGADEPGVVYGYMGFDAEVLQEHSWPFIEIRGHEPGPRLCISAGVHVNEVSSMEAAIRLQYAIDPQSLKGTISIIPVVNQPALYKYTEYNCPIDNKNINFSAAQL